MIRNVLVPLEREEDAGSAVRHACAVARQTGAVVVGKAILEVRGSAALGWLPHTWPSLGERGTEEVSREEVVRVQGLLARFRGLCEAEGVAHEEAYLQGLPRELLAGQSLFYDLVVRGIPGPGGGEEVLEARELEIVIGQTATPFLLVPGDYRPLERVLVCYDGSLAATRAMREFAPLLEAHRGRITVLCADRDGQRARYLLNRAERYLRMHGAGEVEKLATEAPVREAVEEQMRGTGGLVVLGLHSRHGMREWFVGSLAMELMRRGDVALFVGQ